MQPAFDGTRGENSLLAPGYRKTTMMVLILKRNAEHGVQYTSTCRMGIDDLAVVDSDLKVRGIDALRVIDASIMPDIVGGNLNATRNHDSQKTSDPLSPSGGSCLPEAA